MNTVEQFAARVQADLRAEFVRQFGETSTEGVHRQNWLVSVKPGKKYTKVDIGHSGRYMVEIETGLIYGIKAYGVVHTGHRYGDLSTIDLFNWGAYHARRLPSIQPHHPEGNADEGSN